MFYVAIFSLTLVGFLEKGGRTYSEGYFKYKIDEETGKARIFAFTKEGEKQETIVFPTMIGGREVLTLGYEYQPTIFKSTVMIGHEFKSDILRYIFPINI